MSGPADRLAALGLTLPPVTAPVAAYVPALRTGPYVYVSGQVPVADGKLLGTGKVGAEVSTGEAAQMARAGVRGRRPRRDSPHRQGRRLRGQRARLQWPAAGDQRGERVPHRGVR